MIIRISSASAPVWVSRACVSIAVEITAETCDRKNWGIGSWQENNSGLAMGQVWVWVQLGARVLDAYGSAGAESTERVQDF